MLGGSIFCDECLNRRCLGSNAMKTIKEKFHNDNKIKKTFCNIVIEKTGQKRVPVL